MLTIPFNAILFDCDGTLSAIEGITELAKQNGVFEIVDALTERAMATTGLTLELYRQRLNQVQPTRDQVKALADLYWEHRTPDMEQVIFDLQRLGKTVFIISAGIKESILPFAERLNIAPQYVHGVEIFFDAKGRYQSFNEESLLVQPDGKSRIAAMLRQQYSRIAHIGDGINDLEAAAEVDRFIGYGGAYFRQSIANASEFYIHTASLASVLPLLLTEPELSVLGSI